jgi:cytochrome o ubiquinol oxidase operon protein cyoD
MIIIHDANDRTGQGSFGSYITGLVLALALTAVPFWMVMGGSMPAPTTLVGIAAAAVVQIVVHLVFFLHMNGSSGQRWNLVAFLFAVLMVVILVGLLDHEPPQSQHDAHDDGMRVL